MADKMILLTAQELRSIPDVTDMLTAELEVNGVPHWKGIISCMITAVFVAYAEKGAIPKHLEHIDRDILLRSVLEYALKAAKEGV